MRDVFATPGTDRQQRTYVFSSPSTPRRVAILLIGGDKTNRWQEWYDEYIAIADALYDEYLEELRREGELP